MPSSNVPPRGIPTGRRSGPTLEIDEPASMRDEFLSLAAHELMTPLTSLGLQVQRMNRLSERQAEETPAWAASMIDVLGRQVNRLTRLCDDMLYVTKIKSGQLSQQRESFELGNLVREVVARFVVEIRVVPTTISVDALEPLVGRWDRDQIESAVFHLIKNAVAFGQGRPISVKVEGNAGCARLLVRDQGIGIPEEDHARIFECFARGVDMDHFGGLGLGLYIAREIIRAHDGAIAVESSSGQGSTFTVSLPLAPPAAGDSRVRQPIRGSARCSRRRRAGLPRRSHRRGRIRAS